MFQYVTVNEFCNNEHPNVLLGYNYEASMVPN